MGSLWYFWVIGAIILLVVASILRLRYKAEVRRNAAEEELGRLRVEMLLMQEKLASLTEMDEDYRQTREALEELRAAERIVLTEWTLIRSKRVEAYECPNCFGEGIDENSSVCDFCRGAGVIRADRLYTTAWDTWYGSDRDEG